jgi:O-antigen ligase
MTTGTRVRSGSWDLLAPSGEENLREARRRGGPELVLFALLPMTSFQVRGLPAGELAMGLAVIYAFVRRGRLQPAIGITALLLLALLGLMVYSAHMNDLTAYRRLLHIGLYVALAVAASQGRFHLLGMARGLALGLVISAGAWFVGFQGEYSGRLTGLMADPNAAGYLLSVLGCLALAGMTNRSWRWAIGLLLLLSIVLTFSRTTLLATALVLVWLVVGSRVATFFGSIVLGLMILVVTNIPTSLRNFGPFADRTGSDQLRNRIVAQEQGQISSAPWYGHGPGTSKVDVQGEDFFFHNSYLALENEGGRLAVALLLAAGIVALVGLMRQRLGRNIWYEGALIAVAVCAVNLGEVLMELPAALALGMAVCHARSVRAATGTGQHPEGLP